MILKSHGIPGNIFSAKEHICNNSQVFKSEWQDGYSDWFKALTGVRQECNISPLLFALAIGWVMKQSTQRKGIRWTDERNLSDLDFAKKIANLTRSPQDFQHLEDNISKYASNIGIIISAKKTKHMLAAGHPTPTDFFIDHDKLEEVENFAYLISSINNSGDNDHALNYKISKQQQHSTSWTKYCISKKYSLMSMLFCSCETWQLRTSQEKGLNAFAQMLP